MVASTFAIVHTESSADPLGDSLYTPPLLNDAPGSPKFCGSLSLWGPYNPLAPVPRISPMRGQNTRSRYPLGGELALGFRKTFGIHRLAGTKLDPVWRLSCIPSLYLTQRIHESCAEENRESNLRYFSQASRRRANLG